MIRSALIALAAAAAALPAVAQDDAARSQSAEERETEDRIVIQGRRLDPLTLRQESRLFIDEIGDPPQGNHGYAAWEDPLCVSVENLPVQPAQFIIDRIAQVAFDVELGVRGPGCQANVAIIFTTDGRELASQWVDEQPRVFRPYGGIEGTSQGVAALNDFAQSDAAVRWWQITMPVNDEGRPAIDLPGTPWGTPPTARGSNSRITNSIRTAMQASIVIVDASQTETKTVQQLADYLAMVILAQVKPDASPAAHDSILNLFESSAPPPALTTWDASFLRGLYNLDRRRMPRNQLSALSREMARARLEFDEE